MENIFEILDKTGRKIYLSKERWRHITSPSSLHPYMASYLEEVKIALTEPTLIVGHYYDTTKANYFFYLKNKRQYLLVAVKYLNGKGYITTSFIVRNLKKK